MTYPAQLLFHDDGGNAVDVGFFKHAKVSALLLPGDAQDFAQSSLVMRVQVSCVVCCRWSMSLHHTREWVGQLLCQQAVWSESTGGSFQILFYGALQKPQWHSGSDRKPQTLSALIKTSSMQ